MAETVNPTETPQPPSNIAPSASTPSQPPLNPQAPSSLPHPQTSTTSSLPPQPLLPSQQQPPPSPASATMPPSSQPHPQIQTNTSTTSSSYPARAPPGAPGRNYLNTHLAPYLRNGMNNILDAKPQYPLRWLGEYLISQSLIHEGCADQTGVVERFIYEEHGTQVNTRMRPAAAAQNASGGADRETVNGVLEEEGKEAGAEVEAEMERGEEGERRENIGVTDADAAVGAAAVEEDTEMGGR